MDDLLLAIDDETAFLAIIRKIAKSTGFEAVTTTDPAAFKEAVATRSPKIVLLDLQMPSSDGVELLRALSELGCRAKIILLSGADERVLNLASGIGRDLGLDMGAPVQKPIRPEQLRNVLRGIRGKSFVPGAAELRAAIEDDQLELFYQPLMALSTRETIGLEALVRWRHPEYGIVMPDRFIPLAERENLIRSLTDRVLGLAATQLAEWRKAGIEAFVSVNISAADIVADFPDRLTRLCTQHGIPTLSLRLELTETAAMGDHRLMLEVLTRLRLKGFELAIDDFGTGYSSLVQLHRLPFSEIKIDRSFVMEMASSEEANLIVGAIISLGRSMRLEPVAEGIETEDTADRLVSMGCKRGQGYFFSRPMPARDVPNWMARSSSR